jgi:tagatose 6-phosphate kinase
VVLSGSLPPGLPDGTYATLIAAAAGAGVPAVLDAHGEPLRLGAAAGPAIVKPNLPELGALAGRPLTPGADALAAAGGLRDAGVHGAHGAEAVVVTLGRDGLLAVTGDGCWRARPPAAVAGNATGAGDAVAAALAHGLVLGRPWDERLRHAVALGAATAAAPVAGEFRSGDYTGALAAVTVEQVSAEEVG